jgi:nicotinate-nucleotide pyrophosphorylase (carboxylating)
MTANISKKSYGPRSQAFNGFCEGRIPEEVSQLILSALREDIGSGDITVDTLFPENLRGEAVIVAKEPLIVCGQDIAYMVFKNLHHEVRYNPLFSDGVAVEKGAFIAKIVGPLAPIVCCERTALNFLQRMSGVASMTAQLSKIVSDASNGQTVLCDTRKTIPGWRLLDKYAVKTGGGTNHRMGLYDAVLVKNNHIDALAGGLKEIVSKFRGMNYIVGDDLAVEIEVRTLEELEIVLEVSPFPHAILFDNMSGSELSQGLSRVKECASETLTEYSGGVTQTNIAEIAKLGFDRISVGALTHSARAVDMSLRYTAR